MARMSPRLGSTIKFPQLKDPHNIDDHRQKLKARFHNIRTLSIYQLGCQILNATSILYYNVDCGKELFTHRELPYKIFSWDKRDNTIRRHSNMAWSHLLALQISRECMEIRKFKMDLNELRRYVSLILHNYLQEITPQRRSSISVKFNLMEYLRLTLEFIDYEKNLLEKNVELSATLSTTIGDFFAKKYYKPTQATTKLDKLKKSIEEHQYIQSASDRYVINHLKESVNMSQFYYDNQVNVLKTKIEELSKQIRNEKSCFENVLSVYYMEIDDYHNRIKMWSEKYDQEFDAINMKIHIVSSKRDRLRTHHQFLKEEKIRFREEIECVKRLDEPKRRRSRKRSSLRGIYKVNKKRLST